MSYIHFAIGMAIMLVFWFIPVGVLPNVTKVGMEVLGVFIGTIYMWSTLDPSTASLTSVVMLGITGIVGPDGAYPAIGGYLTAAFGNPTVVQMFFLMVFMGGLTQRRITAYIGRWVMTRKFIEGRPWVFTTIIMVAAFLMATFIGCFAPIFLFWPILEGVFDDVGFKKTDLYPKLMMMSIVICALIAFPVPPYMGNGLALLGNYRGIVVNFESLLGFENVMVNNASYFISLFVTGIILVFCQVGLMKFFFKPDVTPMKNVTIEKLNANPLPPMNFGQKFYGGMLIVFIACMLLPTMLPSLPGMSFLNANGFIIPMALCAICCLIKDETGPALNFEKVMGSTFSWPTYWLCLAAIMIGSVLTNGTTGIVPFLNTILSPIFSGMSVTVFTIVLVLVVVLLTNFCNSLVIGMIMQPVVLTYCVGANTNPAPLITLLIFTVLMTAACTPAASPFAAMLFGNKTWLTSGEVYKYSVAYVVVEVVVIIVVGIPLINFLV